MENHGQDSSFHRGDTEIIKTQSNPGTSKVDGLYNASSVGFQNC